MSNTKEKIILKCRDAATKFHEGQVPMITDGGGFEWVWILELDEEKPEENNDRHPKP